MSSTKNINEEQKYNLSENINCNKDTSYINFLVDNWSNELKRKLNAKHRQLCTAIDTQHKQELEGEKKKFSQITEGLINQVEVLQRIVNGLQNELKKKDKIIDKLTLAVSSKNKKFKLMRYFHDWKNQTDSFVKQSKRQLINELDEVRRTQTAHAKYESTLKSALLRGVCALNLETASVFGAPVELETYNNSHNNLSCPTQKKLLQQSHSMFVTPNPLTCSPEVQQTFYPRANCTTPMENYTFPSTQSSENNVEMRGNYKDNNVLDKPRIQTAAANCSMNVNSMSHWENHYRRFGPKSGMNFYNNAQVFDLEQPVGERIVRPIIQSYANNHAAIDIHSKRLLFDSAKESWNLQINANYFKNSQLPSPINEEKSDYFREIVDSRACNEDSSMSDQSLKEKLRLMDHLLYETNDDYMVNCGKLIKSNSQYEASSGIASVYIEKHNPVNSITRLHSTPGVPSRKSFIGIIQ